MTVFVGVIHDYLEAHMIFQIFLQYCVEDETLVNEARNCNPKNSNLVIFDARSMLAAGGNRLKVCWMISVISQCVSDFL